MKVLVCTDGSELSEKAIEAAVGVALPLKAELIGMTAVKVWNLTEVLPARAHRVKSALACFMKRLKPVNCPAGLWVFTAEVLCKSTLSWA